MNRSTRLLLALAGTLLPLVLIAAVFMLGYFVGKGQSRVSRESPETPTPSPPRSEPPRSARFQRDQTAEFDPNDAERTVRWMARLVQPIFDASTGQNFVARKQAISDTQSRLAGLTGRKVRWRLAVAGVNERGISFLPVGYPFPPQELDKWLRARDVPNGYLPYCQLTLQPGPDAGFTRPQENWTLQLKSGDQLILEGEIANAALQNTEHAYEAWFVVATIPRFRLTR
jgi:hypothetical protein